jgi:hypothetical protein
LEAPLNEGAAEAQTPPILPTISCDYELMGANFHIFQKHSKLLSSIAAQSRYGAAALFKPLKDESVPYPQPSREIHPAKP